MTRAAFAAGVPTGAAATLRTTRGAPPLTSPNVRRTSTTNEPTVASAVTSSHAWGRKTGKIAVEFCCTTGEIHSVPLPVASSAAPARTSVTNQDTGAAT